MYTGRLCKMPKVSYLSHSSLTSYVRGVGGGVSVVQSMFVKVLGGPRYYRNHIFVCNATEIRAGGSRDSLR